MAEWKPLENKFMAPASLMTLLLTFLGALFTASLLTGPTSTRLRVDEEPLSSRALVLLHLTQTFSSLAPTHPADVTAYDQSDLKKHRRGQGGTSVTGHGQVSSALTAEEGIRGRQSVPPSQGHTDVQGKRGESDLSVAAAATSAEQEPQGRLMPTHPYLAPIPGSFMSPNAVSPFREWLGCVTSRGRWVWDPRPRLLPWPWSADGPHVNSSRALRRVTEKYQHCDKVWLHGGGPSVAGPNPNMRQLPTQAVQGHPPRLAGPEADMVALSLMSGTPGGRSPRKGASAPQGAGRGAGLWNVRPALKYSWLLPGDWVDHKSPVGCRDREPSSQERPLGANQRVAQMDKGGGGVGRRDCPEQDGEPLAGGASAWEVPAPAKESGGRREADAKDFTCALAPVDPSMLCTALIQRYWLQRQQQQQQQQQGSAPSGVPPAAGAVPVAGSILFVGDSLQGQLAESFVAHLRMGLQSSKAPAGSGPRLIPVPTSSLPCGNATQHYHKLEELMACFGVDLLCPAMAHESAQDGGARVGSKSQPQGAALQEMTMRVRLRFVRNDFLSLVEKAVCPLKSADVELPWLEALEATGPLLGNGPRRPESQGSMAPSTDGRPKWRVGMSAPGRGEREGLGELRHQDLAANAVPQTAGPRPPSPEGEKLEVFRVLVLNRGVHFRPEEAFVQELRETLGAVREACPDCLLIFRNTPPGHASCTESRRPLLAPPPLTGLPFHWGDAAVQGSLAQPLVEAAGGVFLDVATATVLRPDGHVGRHRRHKVDCLHYCEPGPIDLWSLMLLNALQRLLLPPAA